MNSNADSDDAAEVRRLKLETEALQRRVARLARENAHLDRRLERLEASIVFRSLRRIGKLFAGFRSRIERSAGIDDATREKSQRDYSDWVRGTALLDSLVTKPFGSDRRRNFPAVSFLIIGHPLNPSSLGRTLASIRAQSYPPKEIYICTGDEFPEELQVTSIINVLRDSDMNGCVRKAIEETGSEFVILTGTGTVFESGAIRCWVDALSNETAAAYSDWDSIDANGNRHSPRFTPELSPELLLHTMYWGRSFLVRVSELRRIGWPQADSTLPLEHDLALRLAEESAPVARVPRVLWHALDDASREDLNPSAVRLSLSRHHKENAIVEDAAPKGFYAEIRRRPPDGPASIVICSRNPKLLRECLASIRPAIRAGHELIIVAHQADGSTALQEVASKYGARTIAYDGAFHFGSMNELGVSVSTGTSLVFLNDDVQPLARDWLDAMLAQVARPDVGIVGALLLYPDGGIQHAGIVIGNSYVPAHAGRFGRASPYWPWLRMTREVSAVTGACFAMRRCVWEDLGGFDPHFPVNYNDVDLCLRAAQRGYRVIIETRAILTHKESQTRKAVVRAGERELFWERWQGVWDTPDPFFNPQLATPDERIQLRDPW